MSYYSIMAATQNNTIEYTQIYLLKTQQIFVIPNVVMPISSHFIKKLLVMRLTHVSSDAASVQTFTFH